MCQFHILADMGKKLSELFQRERVKRTRRYFPTRQSLSNCSQLRLCLLTGYSGIG